MEVEQVQKKETKTKTITIRITLSDYKWMSEKEVSPTGLFDEALKELKKEFQND